MAKPKRDPPTSTAEQALAPEIVTKPSPIVVFLFLKHAALEEEWTAHELADTLGIDRGLAKQIADELALVGYTEPVPKERNAWRNTGAGNTVAGVKPPRLTRAKAEELLKDAVDRAEAINLEKDRPVRLARVVAFGGINAQHERIQDVDLGIQVETKLGNEATHADVQSALKAIRGRSPSLKLHSTEGWPPRMGRVIWEK